MFEHLAASPIDLMVAAQPGGPLVHGEELLEFHLVFDQPLHPGLNGF